MPTKFTQEIFIDKSMSVHGYKYDYSESFYVHIKEKVKITCREHGPFYQTPDSHMRGAGCRKCGHERTIQAKVKEAWERRLSMIPPVSVDGEKYIPLTNGKFAIVDEEDYDELMKHLWHVTAYGYAGKNNRDKSTPTTFMHLLLLTPPKGYDIDHIDGNRLNNRKSNFRIATRSQNNYNSSPRKGCSSKYKGVSKVKNKNKWEAYINVDKKKISLGYFNKEEDAAKAYDEASKKYHKQFSLTNSKFYGQI